MGSLFDTLKDPFQDPLDLTGNAAAAAADKAAGYITTAAQNAVDEQKRQSAISNANLKPWLTAGTSALDIQKALTGVSGNAAQQQAIGNMQPTPGQLFMQKQQEKAMIAQAAAHGGLGGGNIRADLNKLGILNAEENYNTNYNRLAGISGTGQVSAGNLAGLGQQSAGNIANLQTQAGEARASGILGAGQAQAQGISNIVGLGSAAYGAFGGGSNVQNA